MVPDVIHIGLKRAGSTLLRSFFSSHLDISWSRDGMFNNEKYNNFFTASNPSKIHIDMHEHLSVGMIIKKRDALAKYRFKIDCNDYSEQLGIDPILVSQRIAETIPNAKIIFVLRNQIDWLRTHYKNFVIYLPRKNNRFIDFLTTYEGKLVLHGGLYDKTIESYFNLFERENVLVLLLEEIRSDLNNQLNAICDFLNVKHHNFEPEKQNYHKGLNNTQAVVQRFLTSMGINKPFLYNMKKRVPLLSTTYNSIVNPIDTEILLPTDTKYIKSFYSASNIKTSQLLNLELNELGYPI